MRRAVCITPSLSDVIIQLRRGFCVSMPSGHVSRSVVSDPTFTAADSALQAKNRHKKSVVNRSDSFFMVTVNVRSIGNPPRRKSFHKFSTNLPHRQIPEVTLSGKGTEGHKGQKRQMNFLDGEHGEKRGLNIQTLACILNI